MTTNFEKGTLIQGTHRPQDLIPCFLEAIKGTIEYAQMSTAAFPIIPAYVYDEGDDSEWWDSEEADWLLEDLFDTLDSYAPEGCYFGAHPGDGSDFGFWDLEDPNEEHEDEDEDLSEIKIYIEWSAQDVMNRAIELGKDISTDTAVDILHKLRDNHDAELEVSWTTIDCFLEETDE